MFTANRRYFFEKSLFYGRYCICMVCDKVGKYSANLWIVAFTLGVDENTIS